MRVILGLMWLNAALIALTACMHQRLNYFSFGALVWCGFWLIFKIKEQP